MKTKKEIRAHFNEVCRRRDKHKCVICGHMTDLDVHHIMDRHYFTNGGYVLQNGITLCKSHHLWAEMYHETNGQEHMPGMHPDDLYRMIGSSFDKAIEYDEKILS